MTCREKLMEDCPTAVGDRYMGGCQGCPCDRGYMDVPSWCDDKGCNEAWCRKCWDREIPDTEPTDSTDPVEKGNAVDRPSHYNHGMECIEEMLLVFGKEATMHFCLLNAWKYRKRAIHKNGEEDMRKADEYIRFYMNLKEGKNVRET